MSAFSATNLPKADLEDLCRRRHVRRLSLFGSALRGDFRPESDLDMLVEFETGRVPGFIGLGKLEAELSRLFDNRTIDLHTPGSLNEAFRRQVVAQAEVLFDSESR